MHTTSDFSTSSPTLTLFLLLLGHLKGFEMVLTAVFICISLTPNDGEGDGTPLQYSYLENPMDGGAWWAAVHGVARSWTWLSDFTFTFHFHALGREMATHSSVLAWRIPGTGKPGGLPSMGSHRVGHDWSDLAPAAAMPNDVEYLHVCWQFVYVFWKNVCLDTLPFLIHLSLLLSGKNSSYVLNTGLLPDISLYYLCSFCEPVIILSWKVFL